jgi:hypothetical protein
MAPLQAEALACVLELVNVAKVGWHLLHGII